MSDRLYEVTQSWHCRRNQVNQDTDFVLPLYITDNDDAVELISTQSGICKYGCNEAINYLEPLVNTLGLRSVFITSTSCSIKCDEGAFRIHDKFPYDDSSSCSQTESSTSSSNRGSKERVAPIDSGSHNPFLTIDHNEEDEQKHLLGADLLEVPDIQGNQSLSATIESPRRSRSGGSKRASDSIVRLLPKLRSKFPNLLIICDVSPGTSWARCEKSINATQAAGESLDQVWIQGQESAWESGKLPQMSSLLKLAMEYASCGCNIVALSAPSSDLISELKLRLPDLLVMSYSVEFSSVFEHPLDRKLGTRKLPIGSRSLSQQAARASIQSGADFIMVKPSISYLDVVRDLSNSHPLTPIAVCQTLTEFSLIRLAAEAKLLDLNETLCELLTSYRRAGASIIITHFVPKILSGEV